MKSGNACSEWNKGDMGAGKAQCSSLSRKGEKRDILLAEERVC